MTTTNQKSNPFSIEYSREKRCQRIPPINPFHDMNQSWTIGLCDCCDDVTQCCYAYWCPCCFVCSLAADINESYMSCCCLGNPLPIYRMKVRTVLKIRGDSCEDACVVCWCPCCAALQMRNEVRNRGLA